MRILCCRTYDEMSAAAADIFAEQLRTKPESVLGLATGSTPVGMYQKLAEYCAQGSISFKKASSYNLDEYDGIAPTHDQSYAYFMNANLFSKVDINPANTHIPSGTCEDDDSECDRYTDMVEAAGPIDIQILGIGNNGHIGFNEPSDVFFPNTHRVRLTEETINANARFFDDVTQVPRYALTMGMRPIMLAKKVLLMASGAGKAVAIAKAINGPVTPALPASILQLHAEVIVIADEAALSLVE